MEKTSLRNSLRFLIVELVDGVRVELVGGFSSHLLVVASCSGNEIVATNYDVLGAFVASSFGHWLMVPIFIFNINSFRPLPYLCC
jgi:hypothetical protein